MAQTNMTTTKISRDALTKLRMLAERESRSAPNQLDVLIDRAFKSNPAELTDVNVALNAFSKIVDRSKAGRVSKTAKANSQQTADRISWGEENGKVIGVFSDGRRCDVDGNIIADTHLNVIK